MRGHFADAVVRRIRDPYAVPRAGLRIDRVVAGADPADDPDVGQRTDHALGDRRVLQEDAEATLRGGDHVVLALALRGPDVDVVTGEHGRFEREVGVVVVGDQDAGHADVGQRGQSADVTRVSDDRSSGLTSTLGAPPAVYARVALKKAMVLSHASFAAAAS